MQAGAEWRARQAEIESLEAERELRVEIARARSWLAEMWVAQGLPANSARAIAEAYVPNGSAEAILMNVRARGWKSAGPGIRNALDNYNYLLANQLLLAGVIVKAEEEEAARLADTNAPKPSKPIAQGSAIPQKADDQ
jgi:hypothetical protein